jgi:chromosome segregation ATPase
MSNEIKPKRTLEIIATEINGIKEQTRKMVLLNSIEIGQRLVEAKRMIGHGDWGKWLETSVDYSQSTAQNLMKIFEEYGSDQLCLFGANAKSQALGILNYTQALIMLRVPAEEREQFVVENDVASMSTRELEQAIKERDQALKNVEIAQKVAKEKAEEVGKLFDEKQALESNARVTDKVLQKTQEDVKMLQLKLEEERKDSKETIAKLERALAVARDGTDDEEIRKAQEDLNLAIQERDQKIADLEKQLLEKPIDVPAAVEKIPEEVEQELRELRELAAKQSKSQTIVRYKVLFEDLSRLFKELNTALGQIRESEPDEYEKYRAATLAAIGKLTERLG